MNIFVFVSLMLAAQALLYWLCAKLPVKWLDFVVFAFFLFGNSWLFPRRWALHTGPGGCALPAMSVTMIFWIFGTSSTIIAFLVNGYLLRWREKAGRKRFHR